jgi:triacylglycerol esterase/lipase EstA (alpha/beta hydrolase family)
VHRVYFIPGMFGFGRLAGYDYFLHVRQELERRFDDAGVAVEFEDVPAPPTSSLRFRSRVVAKTVARSAGEDDGPIHLVGHSTGGLDVRLVLSPGVELGLEAGTLDWRRRALSAITMNTPHFGTPLASYFATAAGTRVLYALSLLTFVSLSLGEPSLAMFSRVLAGLGSIDRLFGGDFRLVSRVTDNLLRFVDEDGRGEIVDFLSKVRVDQGGVIQIMPEAIDLLNAAAENDPKVRYGCVATAAPPPAALRFAQRVRSPYGALTAAMYTTLYQFTSQRPEIYPYATPSEQQRRVLEQGLEEPLTDRTNDGVVPTLSMLWGELLWSGEGDHLDVLGHFPDDVKPRKHIDWVTSGSQFTRRRFAALCDALARFMLLER